MLVEDEYVAVALLHSLCPFVGMKALATSTQPPFLLLYRPSCRGCKDRVTAAKLETIMKTRLMTIFLMSKRLCNIQIMQRLDITFHHPEPFR